MVAVTLSELRRENAATEAAVRAARPDALVRDMLRRVPALARGPPLFDGDFAYYRRIRRDQEQGAFCRRRMRKQEQEEEEVLLDEDAMRRRRGLAYLDVGHVELSPDGALLAWTEDTVGSEEYVLRVSDMRKNEKRGDGTVCATNVSSHFAWTRDGSSLAVVELDGQRPFRVCLVSPPLPKAQRKRVLFQEDDPAFYVGVQHASSDPEHHGAVLLIHSGSLADVNECLAVVLDPSTSVPRVLKVVDRARGVQTIATFLYSRDSAGLGFVSLTRSRNRFPNGRVEYISISQHGQKALAVVLPSRPGVQLEGLVLRRSAMVVLLRDVLSRALQETPRELGCRRLRVYNFSASRLTARLVREITVRDFDQSHHSELSLAPGPSRLDFDDKVFRVCVRSMLSPTRTFDVNLPAGKEDDLMKMMIKLVHEHKIPFYDPRRYKCEVIWVPSSASKKSTRIIPVTLLTAVSTPTTRRREVLLYGYGAYGHSIDSVFNASVFSLIDKGFAFAVAHVRGGGELGQAWHDQGRLLHKKNSFSDFVDCAAALLRRLRPRSGGVCAYGGSAGGLLVAAAVRAAPGLFRAAVLSAPFLDVLGTLCDPTKPLSVPSRDEWGDPASSARVREYIASYDPMHTVLSFRSVLEKEEKDAPQPPDVLVLAAYHDTRVSAAEALEYARRLRGAGVTARVHADLETGGHFSSSSRPQQLRRTALIYAFLQTAVTAAARAGPRG